jgi:hypothetical protein
MHGFICGMGIASCLLKCIDLACLKENKMTSSAFSMVSFGRRIAAAIILMSALASPSHSASITLGGPQTSPSFADIYSFQLTAASNDLTYNTSRTTFPPFLGFSAFTATLFNSVSVPIASGVDGPTAFFLTPNTFFISGVAPGSYSLKIAGSTAPFFAGGYSGLLSSTGPIAPIPEPEIWAMMMVGVGLIGMRLRRKSLLDGARHFA